MSEVNIAEELKGVREASLEALRAHREELGQKVNDLKTAFDQSIAEVKKNGVADPETKEKLDRIEKHVDQLESLITKAGQPGKNPEVKSVGQVLTEDERFLDWSKNQFVTSKGMRFAVNGGSFIQNEKALISDTGVGSGTSGVLMPQRRAGIITLPQRSLRIRDLLNIIPFTGPGNSVDFLKENVFTNRASPQSEGVSKAESELTFTYDSCTVRTIAHHMNITRQALDDIAGVRQRIDVNLMYGLKLVEENELLSGAGTGNHLKGLTVQATAYAGTYNASGDTILDKIRHAILEARLALYPVDGIVMHPKNVHDIELIKDQASNVGKYVIGDPRSGQEVLTVWGKPVVESDSLLPGQFLVGAFMMGAEVYDKMSATIDISFEHDKNFIENKATVLAEERLALAVIRPAAFVTGMF